MDGEDDYWLDHATRSSRVPAAALPCRSLATGVRRLLGVPGLALRRRLGPNKGWCTLRAANPDCVGRLPAVPAFVQPTPDRLRPDGTHLTRIQQAEPDGEAACPFDARDKCAQLRLCVRGRAPAGGRNRRFSFAPQARLEPEGMLELRPQRLGCLPGRNGGAFVNATERPEPASLLCHHSPLLRLDHDETDQLVGQQVGVVSGSWLPAVILHRQPAAARLQPNLTSRAMAGQWRIDLLHDRPDRRVLTAGSRISVFSRFSAGDEPTSEGSPPVVSHKGG